MVCLCACVWHYSLTYVSLYRTASSFILLQRKGLVRPGWSMSWIAHAISTAARSHCSMPSCGQAACAAGRETDSFKSCHLMQMSSRDATRQGMNGSLHSTVYLGCTMEKVLTLKYKAFCLLLMDNSCFSLIFAPVLWQDYSYIHNHYHSNGMWCIGRHLWRSASPPTHTRPHPSLLHLVQVVCGTVHHVCGVGGVVVRVASTVVLLNHLRMWTEQEMPETWPCWDRHGWQPSHWVCAACTTTPTLTLTPHKPNHTHTTPHTH